ncbi:hypothetical protein ABZ605_14320 [Streptomyces sp. NPDC012765]|uniref:hypothetical protein n=1 Tax=Streptomyces sp. NPDC012765 TaxID=3155249 RepID=UPI0033FA092F
MTQRLDPGAGWYGEFLRRDPDGVRACLDGAAMPPWDLVESLLRDLAGARGAEFAARETGYAAQLRAAAVTAWDRLPGGEEELRTLLAAAVEQRAESQAALRSLTVRLAGVTDRAETDALTRELAWAQDDVARAAARPADQLPGLAAELTRAGLAADWATLLWEAASLPPERLAAAAAALGAAGREADCDALLRQGVARPAAEVADAALALGGAGRIREADALLGAFVRVRTAEEAAGLARRDPQWLAPRLLQVARTLPGAHYRDLVHALRVAGIASA